MCVQHARGNQFLLQQVMHRLIAGATLVGPEPMEVFVRHVLPANTKLTLAMLCVSIVKVASIQQWSVPSRMFVKHVPRILCHCQQATSLPTALATLEQKGQMGVHVQHVTLENTK